MCSDAFLFVIPNEPSKCSCLHESTYLANGNHREEAQRIRGVTGGKSSRSQPTRSSRACVMLRRERCQKNCLMKI